MLVIPSTRDSLQALQLGLEISLTGIQFNRVGKPSLRPHQQPAGTHGIDGSNSRYQPLQQGHIGFAVQSLARQRRNRRGHIAPRHTASCAASP